MDLEAELLFDADEADDGYENYYRNDQNVAGVAYQCVYLFAFSFSSYQMAHRMFTLQSRA